jgi:hypothetical protein
VVPFYDTYGAAGHVEGQAAIIIRETGSSGGIVYHNHPNGTCPTCRSHVATLLQEGTSLLSVPPRNAVAIEKGWTARARPFIGNRKPLKRKSEPRKSEGKLW